jgi:tetratricopeptide (TPR) repeat protein
VSTAPILTDDPFALTPPDEVAERTALIRAIEMSRGFTLLFACCNRADDRDRLMADVQAHLTGLHVQSIPLREPVRNLLIELRTRLESPPPDAVFIYGVEGWLTSGEEAGDDPFIRNLNVARNHFPREVPIPLVFWLPQHILTTLARAAPDFCSVRSGIYSFCATPEVHDRIVESLTSDDLVGLTSLPYEEKLERADSLAAMLAGYEGLPPGLRDPLAEARLLKSSATLQRILGNFKAAGLLFEKALKLDEEIFGPDHPNTATSLNNLAYIYYIQGRYEESEPIHVRALAIREASVGPDHLDTAKSLNDLGILRIALGQYAEAEQLLQRALKIREASLGPSDPVTAKTLNNLARCYQLQGRSAEAEKLFERALRIKERALGLDYPGTATSLNNQASFYQSQGRYAEAEPLYRSALDIREKSLGRDHPDTVKVLENYASLLHQLGREEDAENIMVRAQAAREAHARRNAQSSDEATSE